MSAMTAQATQVYSVFVRATPEQLWDVLSLHNASDSDINKMTYENALRWYSFEPFGHMTREQATVGALRQAAKGHDVSIHALSRHQAGERATNALAEATKFNS